MILISANNENNLKKAFLVKNMDKKEGEDLLPKLLQEQENNGWISERALKAISKQTNIPISRVYAVATFYSHLHTKKQGQYIHC